MMSTLKSTPLSGLFVQPLFKACQIPEKRSMPYRVLRKQPQTVNYFVYK